MTAGFSKGDRVHHGDHGNGRVVLTGKDVIGIDYDIGTRGAYGSSFFTRFPLKIRRACDTCGRPLNVEGDERSTDCGGDCYGCVSDAETDGTAATVQKALDAEPDTSDIPEATEDWFKRAKRITPRMRAEVQSDRRLAHRDFDTYLNRPVLGDDDHG